MTYAIEEKNLERQQLLAQFLAPISIRALTNISLPGDAKILDLGCGVGATSRMLSQKFPNARITGMDRDEVLIEVARGMYTEKGSSVQFLAGDALQLPFADNEFDMVFARYLFHHVPGWPVVLEEMKRVCRSGGIVFVQEPDINYLQSYPESQAYATFLECIHLLFEDAIVGRKLLSCFKANQLNDIAWQTEVVLADHGSIVKKFYTMTAAALGSALLARSLKSREEIALWVHEMGEVENNPEAIALTHPIIAVWGIKP